MEFADPRSGSPGESYSRGLMFVAGFQPPELQYEIRDSAGLVGYSDYYWESVRLAGEFDGVEKYLNPNTSRPDRIAGCRGREATRRPDPGHREHG